MKLTTNLVNKVGADRLLHFFVCSTIVLAGGCFGDLALFIAFVIALILSVLKEYVFDDREEGNEADYLDILCGFGGCVLGVAVYALSVLL